MCGTAAAASSLFTVTRTISEPARARAATCSMVPGNVGRVGVGHRLHDDRNFPAHANVADLDCGCLSALNFRHIDLTSSLPVSVDFAGNLANESIPGYSLDRLPVPREPIPASAAVSAEGLAR